MNIGHDNKLKVLINRKDINRAVEMLAVDISQDYHDKNPVMIGVIKGAFIFLADLVRHLDFPLEIELVAITSYGGSTESSGKANLVYGVRCPLEGRHVLVVDDIVDTGVSLNYLLDYLRLLKPASLKLCTLLEKPAHRKISVQVDYLGMTVPDRFLIGYGLDIAGRYRNLPDICYIDGADE